MRQRFNYLQNLDAVSEILKHRWLESEKEKRDIGFATAAVDWIKKYGESWKKANHISDEENFENLEDLAERRKYRRFKIDLPVKIRAGVLEIDAQIREFNHIGANLVCKASLAIGSDIEIILQPAAKEKTSFDIHFRSKVIKSSSYKNSSDQGVRHFITTLFDKSTQRIIVNNKKLLFN